MHINDKGFLDPEITKLDINFGESTITHDNVIVQLFMHQFFELAIVVIENSTWALGGPLFAGVLGPMAEYFLNEYQT